ncbi:MAG: MaoC family dehydratase N-terminal domain-containing protein [Spirochaetales bacterium]|nr:MaoC family dehydratase N-terminal domain-containing protein [Spirochaetales bacterium]
MLDMSYLGKEFPEFIFEVDRSKIKELCLAIGDDNPIFFNKEEAQKAGYKDTPASLTFPTLMNFWGYPEIWNRMTEIGIDVKKLLHAKEEYEYFDPIYPGDVIVGKVKVDSMRASSAMDMVTFKSVYSRNGTDVLIAKMTIVVPKGENA